MFQNSKIYFDRLFLSATAELKRFYSQLNSLIAHLDQLFQGKLHILLENGLMLNQIQQVCLLFPEDFPEHVLVGELFKLFFTQTSECI